MEAEVIRRLQQHLVMGTAQFGMNYGVANMSGQPEIDLAAEMVSLGWERGIRYFDTAQAYGTSEAILGELFASLGLDEEPRVITKLHPGLDPQDPAKILEAVRNSLGRLNVKQLWGVMIHREEWLDYLSGSLGRTLLKLKAEGMTKTLGVSVYSAGRAMQTLHCLDIDAIQVQCNVFDRRMHRAGVIRVAQELSKTLYIRSVYLQGLALMPVEKVPAAIPRAREAVTAYRSFCTEHGVNPKRFAIEYVRGMAPNGMLVMGAETPEQVVENCALILKEPLDRALLEAWTERWPVDYELMIDPSRWMVSRN